MIENLPQHPGKILVMDDDQLVLKTANLILQRLGYDAVLAADGQAAVSLYAHHLDTDYPVDLAILDLIVRGGTGGIDTAKMILEIDPDACLVLASGDATSEAMVECQAHGFQGSIAKPYNVAGLGMVVGSLLD